MYWQYIKRILLINAFIYFKQLLSLSHNVLMYICIYYYMFMQAYVCILKCTYIYIGITQWLLLEI